MAIHEQMKNRQRKKIWCTEHKLVKGKEKRFYRHLVYCALFVKVVILFSDNVKQNKKSPQLWVLLGSHRWHWFFFSGMLSFLSQLFPALFGLLSKQFHEIQTSQNQTFFMIFLYSAERSSVFWKGKYIFHKEMT